jgi:hypothetical protein
VTVSCPESHARGTRLRCAHWKRRVGLLCRSFVCNEGNDQPRQPTLRRTNAVHHHVWTFVDTHADLSGNRPRETVARHIEVRNARAPRGRLPVLLLRTRRRTPRIRPCTGPSAFAVAWAQMSRRQLELGLVVEPTVRVSPHRVVSSPPVEYCSTSASRCTQFLARRQGPGGDRSPDENRPTRALRPAEWQCGTRYIRIAPSRVDFRCAREPPSCGCIHDAKWTMRALGLEDVGSSERVRPPQAQQWDPNGFAGHSPPLVLVLSNRQGGRGLGRDSPRKGHVGRPSIRTPVHTADCPPVDDGGPAARCRVLVLPTVSPVLLSSPL